MKKRIWELDALRGIGVLGMIGVHLVYDLTELFPLLSPALPGWFRLLAFRGGVLFLLLSGICVTLSRRCLVRGFTVFTCGMLCTLATLALCRLGLAEDSLMIWFGVLHCLGACMLLWPLFSRLPSGFLLPLSLACIAAGLYLETITCSAGWLGIPLGLVPPDFASSDYFPLLPNLGFFLLGACLGRRLYRDPVTRFPRVPAGSFPLAPLCTIGRHALPIYLFHQPLLTGVILALQWLTQGGSL